MGRSRSSSTAGNSSDPTALTAFEKAPRRMTRVLLTAAIVLLAAGGAAAQQRPLTTEDPATIGAGRILLEAGLDYAREAEYPVSRLEGQLFRFPLIGVSFGISSIA